MHLLISVKLGYTPNITFLSLLVSKLQSIFVTGWWLGGCMAGHDRLYNSQRPPCRALLMAMCGNRVEADYLMMMFIDTSLML